MALLENKVVLLTGASSKIGREIAISLAKEKAKLILHYHQNEKIVSELKNTLPSETQIIQQDFLETGELKSFCEKAISFYGKIDVLINNAAYWPEPENMAAKQSFFEQSEADWDLNLTTNLKAPFFISQYLAPELVKQKGTIINLLDNNERQRSRMAYAVSKSAFAYLNQAMQEILANKINVFGLFLGNVASDSKIKSKSEIKWEGADTAAEKILVLLCSDRPESSR